MRVKMSRAAHFVGTAGLPQTVCPSLKRREAWTSIAGLSSESIRQSCAMRLRSRRMVVAGRSLSWRDRHHGSGDAQARHQTCGQIPSTDVLLRGGADGIRALSADQEAWPRLHRGGALADPEETWRSGEENRRDAVGLAKLSRAGELTAVWVPDERHEAMRDLSRAPEAARKDLKGKRQQVSSFMLRLGRHYPGKKTWGPAHMHLLILQPL